MAANGYPMIWGEGLLRSHDKYENIPGHAPANDTDPAIVDARIKNKSVYSGEKHETTDHYSSLL